MKKKDLLKKGGLAEELGMKFDEASELFSQETLGTMKMANVFGGTGDPGQDGANYTNCSDNCKGDTKVKCGLNCSSKGADCDNDSCGTSAPTSAPEYTIDGPTDYPYA